MCEILGSLVDYGCAAASAFDVPSSAGDDHSGSGLVERLSFLLLLGGGQHRRRPQSIIDRCLVHAAEGEAEKDPPNCRDDTYNRGVPHSALVGIMAICGLEENKGAGREGAGQHAQETRKIEPAFAHLAARNEKKS